MKKRIWIILLALAASMLLGGCALKTMDELYCLPQRSRAQRDLQAVIDQAMNGLEYCVPQSGENQQLVQPADLDGDGVNEYVLFARDNSEKPLKIMIFCQLASGYVLMDTIEGYGFGFDFVSYAQLDDRPGLEIIVGRLVSEDVVRSVSVYRFSSGIARHIHTTSYGRMCVADINADGISSLLLLNQASSEKLNGTLSVYAYMDEQLQKVEEMDVSCPADAYKQITLGRLDDGRPAVYVTCSDDSGLVTDVFVSDGDQLQMAVSHVLSDMLGDVYVYPEDLDKNGILEIPRLKDMHPAQGQIHRMIEWFTVDSSGNEILRRKTYHNYLDNWYMVLDEDLADDLSVSKTGSNCTFYMTDPETGAALPLFTIMCLVDADREDMALQPGRVVLYRSDSVIYVAELEEYAEEYGVTPRQLVSHFKTIRADLKQEED